MTITRISAPRPRQYGLGYQTALADVLAAYLRGDADDAVLWAIENADSLTARVLARNARTRRADAAREES